MFYWCIILILLVCAYLRILNLNTIFNEYLIKTLGKLTFIAFIFSFSGLLSAAQISGLYQSDVLVSSQSAEERQEAFNLALKEVLVRVSGKASVLENEPLMGVANQPDQLVQKFSYEQTARDDNSVALSTAAAAEQRNKTSNANIYRINVVFSRLAVSQALKKYGEPIKLFTMFNGGLDFIKVAMPEKPNLIIEYAVKELLWKPLGATVKLVFVRHPEKGNSIVMSTDLSINALDLIFCYSLRFKIEVLFKQAVHQIGTFMYRFWLKGMAPTKRKQRGDKQLQFSSTEFKEKIKKKMRVYHLFIQLGFIAQGLVQYLSIHHDKVVWSYFGTWLRTIRDNTLPSEMVVCIALKNTYSYFLDDAQESSIFKKFLASRIGCYSSNTPEQQKVLKAA